MTIQNLPVEYRQHLLTVVKQAVEHEIFKNPKHASLHKYLEGISKFLSSDIVVYDKFIEFLKQTALDDQITNLNMSIGNGKLYNILNNNHKHYLKLI
jgi:hypothetical protein